MRRALALCALLGAAGCAGVFAERALPDASGIVEPELRERYYGLLQRVRCPQCDGQALAGSDAPMAEDMKSRIRQLLLDGASDAEVVEWVRQRYGNRALFSPPLNPSTLWLWLLVPVGMLAVVGVAAYRKFGR